MKLTASDIERFWSKVDKSGECWLWTAATFSDGYGTIQIGGQARRAHRIAYVIANGPIAPELFVCHSCDTPRCVNPAHLWLGTAADNASDRNIKGRTRRGTGNTPGYKLPHGSNLHERNPRARITMDDAQAIRARYAAGDRIAALSRAYGLAHSTVSHIVAGRTWRQYIGSRETYSDAEIELDRVATERAAQLAATLADEQAERDEPERCANCGSEHMASPGNGKIYCLICGKPWRAAANPETGPQEEEGEGDDPDALTVDLTDLRAAVESGVRVGVLAAIVSSGVYLHSRGLLLDYPAEPDWALVVAVENLVAA